MNIVHLTSYFILFANIFLIIFYSYLFIKTILDNKKARQREIQRLKHLQEENKSLRRELETVKGNIKSLIEKYEKGSSSDK